MSLKLSVSTIKSPLASPFNQFLSELTLPLLDTNLGTAASATYPAKLASRAYDAGG